jgi:type I restriction enzyme, S subunit
MTDIPKTLESAAGIRSNGDWKPYPAYKDSGVDWLKKMPVNWRFLRGKSVFSSVDVRSKTGTEELLTVSSANGVIPRASTSVTMFKARTYVGHKLCWPGDLVVNSLWAWMQGLGFSRYHGMISSAYSVYRPRHEFTNYSRYFDYLLRSVAYKWELQTRSKGVWLSRLQLSDTDFMDMPIVIPPPAEQAAIVRFLDHYDRLIGQYIRTKQKLIALLTEQKQAIIQRAVTRGLPSTGSGQDNPDLKLKPSGVDWLGDIPEHWEVRRAKYLLREIVSRSTGGTEDLLRVSQYTGVTRRSAKDATGMPRAESLVGYKHARKNDLVVNIMIAWNGSLGVSPHDGIFSPAYCVYRFAEGQAPWYFHHLLRSPIYGRRIKQASTGVIESRLRLYSDALGRIEMLVPGFDEQVHIARYIGQETSTLDTAITRATRQIALMREYRTRLIADVVTGKIDVSSVLDASARSAAAALPNELPDDLPDENTGTADGEDEDVEAMADD